MFFNLGHERVFRVVLTSLVVLGMSPVAVNYGYQYVFLNGRLLFIISLLFFFVRLDDINVFPPSLTTITKLLSALSELYKTITVFRANLKL